MSDSTASSSDDLDSEFNPSSSSSSSSEDDSDVNNNIGERHVRPRMHRDRPLANLFRLGRGHDRRGEQQRDRARGRGNAVGGGNGKYLTTIFLSLYNTLSCKLIIILSYILIQGQPRGRNRGPRPIRVAFPRQQGLPEVIQQRFEQIEGERIERRERGEVVLRQANLNEVFAVVQQPPAVHDDRSRAELRARVPPRDANNLVQPRFRTQPGAEPRHPFIWEANRDPDRGRSNSPDEGRDGRRRDAENGRLNEPPAVDDDQPDEPQVAADAADVGLPVPDEPQVAADAADAAEVGLQEEEVQEGRDDRHRQLNVEYLHIDG